MGKYKWSLVLAALLAVPQAPVWGAPNLNWLVNGDFKSSGGWNNNVNTQPGRNNEPAAYFENISPVWS
ncbi:MAG TPA: hypothetical protein VN963_04250, partial [bacterium]|nr:hypothetical protein [bacterium]